MRFLVAAPGLAALMLASASCSPANSLRRPSVAEIERIVMEESDCRKGINITEVKIIQAFFEQKQKTCKARLKIGVVAKKTIVVYIRKSRRDFMPNFILWKAGDKKVIDADAVLAYESDKKWHLREYY